MNFTDTAEIIGFRETEDGYLVGEVNCARTGIQHYHGDECGQPQMGVIAVYRPEEEVHKKDSLRTYVGKPVTNEHPDELVNAGNWKDYSVGDIGEEVLRNGDMVRVPIKLMDADTIKLVKDGKREVSMGYTTDLIMEDGITKDGEPYQAKQTNIRINHLAIVPRGRAGNKCRIGDSAKEWGVSPLTIDKEDAKVTKELQKVIVDGLSVETTDQGAQAIGKLQKDVDAANQATVDAKATHDTAIAAKDTELAKKDAEIDALKSKVLSDGDVDKLVAERSELIAKASVLAKDGDFAGLSAFDIQKKAVVAVRGADSVLEKSDAYVSGMFDILVEQAEADGNVDHFKDAVKKRKVTKVTDNGQGGFEDYLKGKGE